MRDALVHSEGDHLAYSGEIGFEHGQAKLKKDPETKRILSEIEALLKQHPALKLTIEGHTDSRGRPTYNRELSLMRAFAIRTWWVRRGIAKTRLEAVGKGEDAPAVPEPPECDNQKPRQQQPCEEAWAENRRFRFVITAGADSLEPAPPPPVTEPSSPEPTAPHLPPTPEKHRKPPPGKVRRPVKKAESPKPQRPAPPKVADEKPRAVTAAHRGDESIRPRVVERLRPCPGLVGLRFTAGGPASLAGVGLSIQPGVCWLELGLGASGGMFPLSAESNGSTGHGSAWSLSVPFKARIWWMRRHSLLLDLGGGWADYWVSASAKDGDGQSFKYSRSGDAFFVNAGLGYGYRAHRDQAGFRFALVFGVSKHLSQLPQSTLKKAGSADTYDAEAIRSRLDRRLGQWLGLIPYAEISLGWVF